MCSLIGSSAVVIKESFLPETSLICVLSNTVPLMGIVQSWMLLSQIRYHLNIIFPVQNLTGKKSSQLKKTEGGQGELHPSLNFKIWILPLFPYNFFASLSLSPPEKSSGGSDTFQGTLVQNEIVSFRKEKMPKLFKFPKI